jgi:hypothetical protein
MSSCDHASQTGSNSMIGKWYGSAILRSMGLLAAIVLALAASTGLAEPNERALENVLAVQSRNSVRLMAVKGVVGTATGLAPDGLPAVIVYSKGKGAGPIPKAYGEIPVVVEVTGEIFALKKPPNEEEADPRDRFDAPVPIGVSTGNEYFYGVGTIGCRLCRVTTNGDWLYYALSNHHVFDPYDTEEPERIVQPGRGDDPNDDLYHEATQENLLGGIAASVPLNYSGGDNLVDATIAEVPILVIPLDGSEEWTTRALDTSTPSGGYGSPLFEVTVPNPLGMSVQKYGRTTQLTKGVVQAIYVNIEVNYDMFGEINTAIFTNQIAIKSSRGAFARPGDSGSLVVTDPGREAVGLLFAGDFNGRTGFANPIDTVLGELGVDMAIREGLLEPVILFVDGE